MSELSLVATAADACIALLAFGLGARFLLVSQRLGGLTVLRLPGLGFVALALSAPLLSPSVLGGGFDVWDAARIFLQVMAFAAIGLGYLLAARHGDMPERGFGFAYQVLLLAGAVGIAPFVAFEVLHPVLAAVDTLVYLFTAALAGFVALRMARPATRPGHQGLVAIGFTFLACSQVVLAVAGQEQPGLEQLLAVGADATLLAGLLAFAGTLLLERREAPEAGRGP
ncbi:MAG: hypothetical protein LC624_08435 [Halobacteriales archaeon]|nr:hypothetical protein [Halobacteriales archaeon]